MCGLLWYRRLLVRLRRDTSATAASISEREFSAVLEDVAERVFVCVDARDARGDPAAVWAPLCELVDAVGVD